MKIYKAWAESLHKITYIYGYYEDEEDALDSIKDVNTSASLGDKGVELIETIPKKATK